MQKLEERMGAEALQRGLREYLSRFSYANATWDDLIDILGKEAPQAGIADFDRQWVKQAGIRDVGAYFSNCSLRPRSPVSSSVFLREA